MNKILLIVIILLISCYLILNIKEGFQFGKINVKYYDDVDDFYFIGNQLPQKSINHLTQINIDNDVSDLGICMEECNNNDNCYSFKFFKDSSNQKSCIYYSNKVLDNGIQNDIQSCKDNNCYYNKRNGNNIPYDDMKEDDTNRFHKNKTACHPNDKINLKINDIATDLQPTSSDGFIKQCAENCKNNSDCKSFTVFNNVKKIDRGPKFNCEYYRELCSQGTNSSNNLNRHEVYASYDIYDCGEFECRKNININNSGTPSNTFNIYCNNNKYSYPTSANKTNKYNSKEACENDIKELKRNDIICQKDCDSGGGIPFDDAKISISSSELPPIYFY